MKRKYFDFTDVSDVPEAIGRLVWNDYDIHARRLAEVVRVSAEEGLESVGINAIIVAGMRMNLNLPTQATVRIYLNHAVKMGLLSKPSRVTYSFVGDPTAGRVTDIKATRELTAEPEAQNSEVPDAKAAPKTTSPKKASKPAAHDPLAEIDDPLAGL